MVSFKEGRVGKETIKRKGGVVDIMLSDFPPNRGLIAEVINVVWVIGRGKGYGGLRCGGVVSGV